MRTLIQTKVGDKYDPKTLNRDFMTLWNTGRFEDIRLEREAGQHRLGSSPSWSPNAASSGRSNTTA